MLSVLLASTSFAAEPNESFGAATVLPSGQLSVIDELLPPSPDTVLGAFGGLFGDQIAFDDNSSPLGNGLASAFYDVPTSSGAIEFSISGSPDSGFSGGHAESGSYEAFVTVYDLFGDEVDDFSVVGELSPGSVDNYSDSDFNWLNGSYSVEIDNAPSDARGDVDFFTFTGLAPGSDFVAETFPVASGVPGDSLLGWFSDTGIELDFNDDKLEGVDFYSRLEGVVPASGNVTLVVTGFGDGFYSGEHEERFDYELVVTPSSTGLPGDYNSDGAVDAADYTVYRDGLSGGQFNLSDYQPWADNYGRSATLAVPEPGALGGAAVLLLAAATRSRR